MNKPSINELFFPLLNQARSVDPALNACCLKINKKLEAYAESIGIVPRELRLLDVCTSAGHPQPKLLLHIKNLPVRRGQSEKRRRKYKEEIVANIRRAVCAVVTLINENTISERADKKKMNLVILPHDDPILDELYELLPKEPSGPTNGNENKSENGMLSYASCLEALKRCTPLSLKELVFNYRQILSESVEQVCPTEKIPSVNWMLYKIRSSFGGSGKRKKRLPVEEWPSPIREEMRVLQDAKKGILAEGALERAINAGIKLRAKISPSTVFDVEASIGRLVTNYPDRERLSVRDILATTETKVVGQDGKERTIYYNEFLTPLRDSERARVSKYKRAGFDSQTFANMLDSAKTLAAYNGIFDYHQVTSEAFKVRLDLERRKERKAQKKMLINRHVLDEWIENNWSKFEQIVRRGSFKRDKIKRKAHEADKNMRFVLFYIILVTLKVMGFRQRQLRDCVYGENISVTSNSIMFSFPAEKTKNGKHLYFTGDLETCEATHGILIKALYLFHRYCYVYIQDNLTSWQTGNAEEDENLNPRGQFFLYLCNNGKFKRFHPLKNKMFSVVFKTGCLNFLKSPGLQKEAILLCHPHFFRGSAMDTFILDHGGSIEAAGKYFGATPRIIEKDYKDGNAISDASRDVVLINARKREISELMQRERDGRGYGAHTDKGPSRGNEIMLEELRKARENERKKDAELILANARINTLESLLSQLPTQLLIQHREIIEAIRGSSSEKQQRGIA